MNIFILGLLYLLGRALVRGQCYINSLNSKTFCLSCGFNQNFDFPEGWPGGETEFLSSACKYMSVRPKLEVFISPLPCSSNSTCNGSLSDPFDNLVNAFKYAWRSNASEMKFFLLSDMKENEDSVHFINKADYSSEFQYLFRRYSSDVYVMPLYCSVRAERGCLRNSSLRPTVLIRTQSLYFFVTRNFFVSDVIFDGSEISLEDLKLINKTNEKRRICREEELDGRSNLDSVCDIRKRVSAAMKPAYGLFNVETMLDCRACYTALNGDKLVFNNTEFKYFYSFEGKFVLGSLITVQSLRFSIAFNSCTFVRNMLPNGLINSIPMPDYYSSMVNEYIVARDSAKDRILKLDNCTFSDHNHLGIIYNPADTRAYLLIYFSQISFEITISNCVLIGTGVVTGRNIDSASLIYADVPENDAKIINVISLINNTFQQFSLSYLVSYRKTAAYNGKRITVVVERNIFKSNINSCFDFVLTNVLFRLNKVSDHSFDACSFFQINYGNLSAYDNEVRNLEDKFSGAFIDFKGEQTMADDFIFDNSFPSNKSYQEGAILERNTFIKLNMGIVRSNTTLILLLFNNNIIQALENNYSNITSGKVERELTFSNNIYENVTCFILFHHEIFKNISIVNNSFKQVAVSSLLRAWLYSPSRPFSLVFITDNTFESFLFHEFGFTLEPFYVESGIDFFIVRNSFFYFHGSPDGYLFGLSYSTAILFDNLFLECSGAAILHLKCLPDGDKEIAIDNSAFKASDEFPLNFFLSALDFDFLAISSTSFRGNKMENFGISMIYASSPSGTVDIRNSEFFSLSARSAGALVIKVRDFSSLRIMNCQFTFNKAPDLGGDITVETMYRSPSFVRMAVYHGFWFGIVNNTFRCSQGGNGGSIRLLEGTQTLIRLNYFYSVSAQRGAVVHISQRSDVIFSENMITNATAKSLGGSVYASKSYLTIRNCEIIETRSEDKGGGIYADDMAIFISFLVIRLAFSKVGAGLFCQSCTMRAHNFEVHSSTAKNEGGTMFMSGGQLKLHRGRFSSLSMNSKGGAFLFDNLESLIMENITIFDSTAGADGVVYIYGNSDSFYRIWNLTCQNNSAVGQGDCLFVKEGNLVINSLSLIENSVKGCLLCFYGALRASNFSLSRVSLLRNKMESNAILISGCRVWLRTTVVNYSSTDPAFVFLLQTNSYLYLKDLSIHSWARGARLVRAEYSEIEAENLFLRLNRFMGGFLAIKCELLSLKRVAIERALTTAELDSKGAAIYAEESNLLLESCNISSSHAKSAGALYAVDSTVSLSSCFFYNNTAESKISSISLLGDHLNKKSSAMMSKCLFLNNIEIKIQGLDSLSVQQSELILQYQAALGIHVLTLVDIRTINFNKINVKGYFIKGLGGVHVISKEFVSNILLNDFRVLNMKSEISGAGLKLDGKINGTVSNCVFENNWSGESGGAIYVDGPVSQEEKVSFIDCVFSQNSAVNSGNILKTSGSLPVFIFRGVEHSARMANDGNFASYPSKIFVVSGADWNAEKIFQFFSLSKLEDGILFDQIASGQATELTCAIFDHYGNLLMLSDNNKIRISDPLPMTQALSIQNGLNMIQSGVAIFRDLIIIANPNTSISLAINFYDESTQKEVNENLTIHVRSCIKGEIFAGRKCEVCPINSFSLDPDPMKNNISVCEPCSVNARCPGGDRIVPLQGYWRKDENQTTIAKCFNEAACLEVINSPNAEFTPVCGEKYKGNLCANCQKGFGKTGSSDCKSCNLDFFFLFKYFTILVLSIFMTSYQIHTAFSINEREIKHRCLMKLITNHFTFIGLLSRFKIDWESTTRSILNLNDEYFTTIPSQLFYFDCFIDNFVAPENKFLFNSVLVSLSPFMFGFLNLLFLYFVKLVALGIQKSNLLKKNATLVVKNFRKNNKSSVTGFNLKEDFTATCLIIFYNFYSKLLINVLSWIKCIKIDDSSSLYLESDPDLLCWNRKHFTVIWTITLPSFLVWIVVIPLILLIFVNHIEKHRKSKISPLGTKIFNFIALDYQEKYYYWDSFSFITKFLLVLCYMSTNSFKPPSQGAFLIMILLVLFLLQEKLKPYKYRFVNNLLSCSYIVTLCTGASAILSSAEDIADTHRLIFLGLFLAFNLFFYFAWLYCLIKERPFIYNYFERLSRGIYFKMNQFGDFFRDGFTKKSFNLSRKSFK